MPPPAVSGSGAVVTTYEEFLATKRQLASAGGFEPSWMPDWLFPFQRALCDWAIRRGRAAIFADCGLGKTPMQLVWAQNVIEHTGKPVLIATPLAVSYQTIREAEKFGIGAARSSDGSLPPERIVVTNYERLEHFRPGDFAGVVLDESSILKSYTGATRNALIRMFSGTPYRLCCTATPAPNDYTELGNHSEFLGVLTRVEMLATYFTHDGADTSKWRLKGHARRRFWEWLATWGMFVRRPSDLGYEDDGFTLPALRVHDHCVASPSPEGQLFHVSLGGLQDRRAARRASLEERCQRAAEIVSRGDDPTVVWCNLNAESERLVSLIPGAVEIRGSDQPEAKSERLEAFSAGRIQRLVTKPTIAGFGLNWQHCGRVVFVGLSDSFEQYYQAVRRFWRFGRKDPVDVHIVYSDAEGEVVDNVRRKERAAARLMDEVMPTLVAIEREEIAGMSHSTEQTEGRTADGDGWEMRLGDSVELTREIDAGSVGLSVFSPPFASLYTYSASDRDMGNCQRDSEFFDHFGFLIPELLRVTVPGRLCAVHCMNLPTLKERDGVIGLRDFRGALISAFVDAGWIYHSEVCIWKDPLVAATRTKALGLLHKQLCKDSAMSRQGLPDYLCVFRKPGENPRAVARERGFEHYIGAQENEPKAAKTDDPGGNKYSHEVWQRYASPVWMDIVQTKTLQSVAEENDERHICPLQLQVIERAIELWSIPGDLVLDPFAGIGSTGYEAVKADRLFVGIELKEAYFDVAVKNLKMAEHDRPQISLFPASVTR